MPGTPSFIQLPTDAANTGKKLQTWDNTLSQGDVYAEAVVLVDSTGVEKGTSSNPVRVDPVGTTIQPISGSVTITTFVSVVNSTSTPLVGGGTFTGTAESTVGFNTIGVTWTTDQVISVDVQQSPDGTNWDWVGEDVDSGVTTSFFAPVREKFYRLVVTNLSVTNQTFLRLQTILYPVNANSIFEESLFTPLNVFNNTGGIQVVNGSTPLATNLVEVDGITLSGGVAGYGITPSGTAVMGVNAFGTNTPTTAGGTPLSAPILSPAGGLTNDLTQTNRAIPLGLVGRSVIVESNPKAGTPYILQKTNSATSGSSTTLTATFASNNVAGNTIVVVMGSGNGAATTVTDTQGNTYFKATPSLNTAVFYATNIAVGANTVTITLGTASSIAMEIYEVYGLASLSSPADQSTNNAGNSTGATTGTITPTAINEIAFSSITAAVAGTITNNQSSWSNDSGTLSPVGGGSLASFASFSSNLLTTNSVFGSATVASGNWAASIASFRGVAQAIGIDGAVVVSQSNGSLLHVNVDNIAAGNVGQGSPAALASAWPIKITDGTNGPTAVKAASTAAVATDPAVVVAISPNNSVAVTGTVSVNALPTGGNTIGKVDILGNAGATLDSTVGSGTAPTNAQAVSSIFDTTAPAPTNGQAQAVQSDQAGNVLTFPGSQFKVGTVWNSSTTVNTLQYPNGTATPGQLLGVAAVMVSFTNTTPIGSAAVTFEGTYDNVTYVTLPGNQVLVASAAGGPFTGVANPFTLTASLNQPFIIILNGAVNVRARLSTVVTGAGTVTPNWNTITSTPVQTVQGSAGCVAINVVGTGTAGAPGASVLTVQGVASGTAQPVSGTVGIQASNGNTVTAVVAAATSPQSGVMGLAENVTTAPALTTGQSVAAQCDWSGSLFVKPYRRSLTKGQATTIASSGAATTVVTAGAAGIFNDIAELVITATGQATNVAFTATLSDGTNSFVFDLNTGSTTTFTPALPLVIDFNPPLAATTAATAWTITLSSAAVTAHISINSVQQKAS